MTSPSRLPNAIVARYRRPRHQSASSPPKAMQLEPDSSFPWTGGASAVWRQPIAEPLYLVASEPSAIRGELRSAANDSCAGSS